MLDIKIKSFMTSICSTLMGVLWTINFLSSLLHFESTDVCKGDVQSLTGGLAVIVKMLTLNFSSDGISYMEISSIKWYALILTFSSFYFRNSNCSINAKRLSLVLTSSLNTTYLNPYLVSLISQYCYRNMKYCVHVAFTELCCLRYGLRSTAQRQ